MCFNPCRYLHEPLWLLPAGATVAGWDSHPPGKRAFPRRTEKSGLGLRVSWDFGQENGAGSLRPTSAVDVTGKREGPRRVDRFDEREGGEASYRRLMPPEGCATA